MEIAVDRLVDGIEQVLAPELPFNEKLLAFASYLTEIIASGRPLEARATVFSSADLQTDPEIRKIKEAARERMTGLLLLRLVAEGRAQGQVDPSLPDEALRIYFGAFICHQPARGRI